MRRRLSSLCSVSSRMPSAMRSALVTAAGNRCIKRERNFSHALSRSPATGICGYMKRQCALSGAPSLTYRPHLKCCSISRERLVSVDANSRRDGFLPPHQSSAVSAPGLPPQNATNYTTLPANKKPPPKIHCNLPSLRGFNPLPSYPQSNPHSKPQSNPQSYPHS